MKMKINLKKLAKLEKKYESDTKNIILDFRVLRHWKRTRIDLIRHCIYSKSIQGQLLDWVLLKMRTII